MPTKIEWTDSTWNPITGCGHAGTPGCDNCYARRLAETRLRGRFGYPADRPFRVAFHADKLDQPERWHKPRRIFVSSMGDFWHPDVLVSQRYAVIQHALKAPQHTYMFLTKRPERIDSTWPDRPNFWLGVTAENQAAADERIPLLLRCPAAMRFVSVEPLLSELTIGHLRQIGIQQSRRSPIDQLIIGPETGRNRRPCKPEWVESLVDQADAAGIAVFVKAFPIDGKVSKNMAEWPEWARRREFPNDH